MDAPARVARVPSDVVQVAVAGATATGTAGDLPLGIGGKTVTISRAAPDDDPVVDLRLAVRPPLRRLGDDTLRDLVDRRESLPNGQRIAEQDRVTPAYVRLRKVRLCQVIRGAVNLVPQAARDHGG